MEQNELRMNLQVPQTSPGEYLVLRADLPGVDPENIGILLLDSKANRLYCRMRRDMHEFAEVDADWFEHLADDIREKSQELGAQQYLAWMESTLSNILLISERERIPVDDFEKTAARLYAKHVRPRVLRFRTHLPQYSLEAAAGQFGRQMDVHPEGWIEVCSDVPLAEDMFVTHVVGHSMEPIIPNGSLCAFRHVDGLYSGKVLLVEHYGEQGGDRYAVSRYFPSSSLDHDTEGNEAWLHERFTLEPANPEYKSWDVASADKARVLGEFLFVVH
jgi:SOS-response transcriptional repressor LexA